MRKKKSLKNNSYKLPKSITTVTGFSKFIALCLFILLPFAGFMIGARFQAKVDNAKINSDAITDSNTGAKTYQNSRFGFSFNYSDNYTLVFPSHDEYKFAPDQIDMTAPEKTRDITIENGNNKILHILLLSNANTTLNEIKKNPTQGGGAPIKNLTDTTIGNTPSIEYQLDCTGLKGCFEGPFIQTVHHNVQYIFTIYNKEQTQQILSTFKFTQ